jgi:peptidoglycan/xylan/chitin deacetylase (PgdA/CDA1 family)
MTGQGSPEDDPARTCGAGRLSDFDLADYRAVVSAQETQHEGAAASNWPDQHQVAVNLTADFDAMLLRRLLGEPPMQLAMGEFGGRVGIWRLLELFNRHDVKATLFVPGRITQLYPRAIRAFAESGHEIADHMWEHHVPKDPAVERAHLQRSTAALAAVAGTPPVGTRSTHTPALLAEHGYIYNSHYAAYRHPYTTRHGHKDENGPSEARLVNLPFHFALDDAQFFSFGWMGSGNGSQRIADPTRVLDMWWDAFMDQYREGGYFNLCLHPFVSGRAARIDMLDELIVRMKSLPKVWFPTCRDVAEHHLSDSDRPLVRS